MKHKVKEYLATEKVTIDILRLIRSENVGIKTYQDLIRIYGSAKIALEKIAELSIKGGRNKPINIYSQAQAEQELANCYKIGAKIISHQDYDYPELLKHITDYPPIITVLGNIDLFKKQNVAIVGSRVASANSCRFAYKIAQQIGKEDYIVVSGLARGIDTAAHKGALDYGTIAVIAGGIDNIYPPENKDLYYKISQEGLVIAELPYGSIPKAKHFPQRNRIISGLSLGVLVVEASLRSGSLITSRLALEQNREVMAVPGFPLDPRCQGTNQLIKKGAHLVESIDDVINAISYIKPNKTMEINELSDNKSIYHNKVNEQEVEEARTLVLSFLSSTPCSVDEILTITKLPINVVITVIIELELAGKIERWPGNKISLVY